MNTIQSITIDMVRPGIIPLVRAMQYDTNTRVVEIALVADGVAWMPPEGAALALSYRKADGTRGFYNKLSDDMDAISLSGNKVSVILAHQVLTVPGQVEAALVIGDAGMDRLSSFPFAICVTADPGAGTTESDDYFHFDGTGVDVEQITGKVLQALPIAVTEEGYTEISGLRQATGITVAREGRTITVTATLEGGGASVSVVTLDDNDDPVSIVTDGVACPVRWEGFDV